MQDYQKLNAEIPWMDFPIFLQSGFYWTRQNIKGFIGNWWRELEPKNWVVLIYTNCLNRLIKKSVETFLTLHLTLYQILTIMSSFFHTFFHLCENIFFSKSFFIILSLIISHGKENVKFFSILFQKIRTINICNINYLR